MVIKMKTAKMEDWKAFVIVVVYFTKNSYILYDCPIEREQLIKWNDHTFDGFSIFSFLWDYAVDCIELKLKKRITVVFKEMFMTLILRWKWFMRKSNK